MNGGPEQVRIDEMRGRRAHWNRWGPYLSERAWATVREDYSADGDAWEYFTHHDARYRAYRWNEDGLLGICDRHQRICFALALWNGRDPFLKERLFGLSNVEGNHGEDVKEAYFYLDNTPSHSYMKALYKYPQSEFPYQKLVDENRRRTRDDPEYELPDTGVFAEDRYFDVFARIRQGWARRYAGAYHGDQSRSGASNGARAPHHLVPQYVVVGSFLCPAAASQGAPETIELNEPYYGRRRLYAKDAPELLFTENVSNRKTLWGTANESPYVKDGFHAYVVDGDRTAVNPEKRGTKAAAHYAFARCRRIRHHRNTPRPNAEIAEPFGPDFAETFADRIREADEFYDRWRRAISRPDGRAVMRQAFAGLLWSKQFYHYVVRDWLNGDPRFRRRLRTPIGRNHEWTHLYNSDVISMPDNWEYPWYAAWDLAFHCLPLALIDSEYAKDQLVLMLREWYLHPNGQLPAYEWNFSDVNPPVHAWAAWRVYKIEAQAPRQAGPQISGAHFPQTATEFHMVGEPKGRGGQEHFPGRISGAG